MASKAPPPLIRSSKAFSVEIPEGSNSAKSRRSDIVANDDLDIHKSTSNFMGDAQGNGLSHGFHEDAADQRSGAFAENQGALANHNVNDHQEALKDRFATEQGGQAHNPQLVADQHGHAENLAKIPNSSGAGSPHNLTVGPEAIKDNLQGVGNDAIKDNLQGVGNEAIKDNKAGVAKDAIKDNLQGVGNDALKDNLQGVGNEAIKDNKAGLAKSPEAVNPQTGAAKDAIKDNLQGVGTDSLEDNLQGVGNEAIKDNKTGLAKSPEAVNPQTGAAKDAIKDNLQGVGNDALQDNLQGVGKEHEQDRLAGVAQDALKDNLQGVGNDALKDNQAGIAKEGIQDNLQGVGNEQLQDRQAGAPEKALQDNMQGIGTDALQDNPAGIAKEHVEDHDQGIGKEHLEDHIAQIPSTERQLKDGPTPGVHQTHFSESQPASVTSSGAVAKKKPKAASGQTASDPQAIARADMLHHLQEEKAKRMEEFHGRVDAIRKTVSGINHKLDDLDEEGSPLKH